ncbi:MAG TPA: HEPN domain-containing protein [Smithella sp.]|nr:HEPN domain-containing protein [Smithella sp.]HNY51131.1 HEPN domain-containing protein [Smithella sp.]HOG90591.1 HEPN domain-containing protein [Smithella sp.]HOU50399.1 HEPN domain-containing protein [Smithella sp.]HQG64397.1 HEPN domain-containing protein [Smithella sp.]
MEKQDIVKYWVASSDLDYEVMQSLFTNGYYSWSLFLSHLVIEKLLKAYYVKNLDENYPRIHNLIEIAEKAALILSENQKVILEELTTFNLRARYPDYKNRFNKKATRQFTEDQISKVNGFRKWLLEKINN